MAARKPKAEKKYYTIAEANATLPLVRAIVRDITILARDLRERQGRLARLQPQERGSILESHREELQQALDEFERDQERLVDYERELRKLGVELKDYLVGLIDFPCWMEDREVYLCWRFDESEVMYWHELQTGFAGRQRIRTAVGSK
jgi:hypothetical protein